VKLFGVKFGHAGSSGSTAAPINVQSPFLKLTQFLWIGNPDCFECDITKTTCYVVSQLSISLRAFPMDSLTLVPGLTAI
jgi:hypothetical protein